jgi:hypothetical protein
MSEIRNRLENVLRFPRALPQVSHVWLTTKWIQASAPGSPASWRLIEDSDRSLLLIPLGGPEPGFVITLCAGEYEVMICEPDDIDELGPFGSLSEALDGITNWLALPSRDLTEDLPPAATDMAHFRPSFALPCPAGQIYHPPVGN